MRHIAAPFFAIALLLGTAAAARAGTIKYTCDPITFPDGSDGVAVVRVILSSGGPAAAPTVMVTVDYYSPGYEHYLGRYEDWSNSSNFPQDEYGANDFAFNHFNDRW